MLFSSLCSLTALFLGLTASPALASLEGGAHKDVHARHERHHELAERSTNNFTTIAKRGFSGQRTTWYTLGEVACGGTHSGDEAVVALSQQVFGFAYPSKYCNRRIEISYGGKTHQATIVDSCVACPAPGGLDLSTSLFKFFAPISAGVIAVDWHFVDGDDGDDEPPKPPKPEPKPPKPTPKPVERKTTSKAHPTTTHKTTSTHKTTTKHSTKPTTTSHATSATPTPSKAAGNLQNLNRFVLNAQNMLNKAS